MLLAAVASLALARPHAVRAQTAPGAMEAAPAPASAANRSPAAQPAPASATGLVTMDQVVTLGSRFSGRTATDSPVPVDLLSGDDLHQGGGYTDLTQLLATIDPGIDFPHPTNQDGYDSARAAAFGGLAPDQTLVLLNGKRYHTSADVHANGSIGLAGSQVDLDTIPAYALAGAEVLRDGASAQYGSDAIAGVVNLSLRHDPGASLMTTLGEYENEDGRTILTSAYSGTRLGSGGGFVSVTGYFKNSGYTNRSGYDQRQQYFGTNPSTGAPVIPGTVAGQYLGTPDPREATIPRHDSIIGDPSDHSKGIFLNLAFPLNPAVEVYAWGGFNRRLSTAYASWRRPADDNTLRLFYPNGFQAQISPHLQDFSLTGGARGTVGGWQWDLSETYGSSQIRYYSMNSANVSFGAASPTRFYDGELLFAQAETELDLARQFTTGLDSPLKVAFGSAYRHENYQIFQGDYNSWANGGIPILDGPDKGNPAPIGAQGFPGFQPADQINANRDNVAGYVEFEQQLTPRWDFQLSGRAERYNDAGTALTGKAAMLYKLFGGLSARASFSNGFRAPALQQEYLTATSEVLVAVNGATVPLAVRTFGVNNPAAVALGATPLKPETSTDFSGGFTWQPNDRLSASIDYYDIRVAHQIVISSNFTSTAVANYLAGLGYAGLDGGRYFTNGASLRNQGFDATSRYALKFDGGDRLTLTAAYDFTQPLVTSARVTPANVLALTGGTPILNRQTLLRIQHGFPLGRAVLAETYELGHRFTFIVREDWYGSVFSSGTTAATDQWLNPQWVADAEITWHFNRHLSLALGLDNLLDTYPTKLNAANNTSGLSQYSQISPYGYDGAFGYTRVEVRF
jgi:iron complex outermembrane receptor protein